MPERDQFNDPVMASRSGAARNDAVLARLQSELRCLYGDRIERVILFGSRARGDAEPGSDYDIAIFLKDLSDRWPERRRLADLRVKMIDDTSTFFDILPFAADAYDDRSPLMREIRRDGLTL